MIKLVGELMVDFQTMCYAQSIREENYKVNTPSKYQKHCGNDSFIINQLVEIINRDYSLINYVFFSCKEGAEPHTDKLNLSRFDEKTVVIPLILPNGKSRLLVEDETCELQHFLCYEFDHTKVHSLILDDTTSGCVLIMATALISGQTS